MITWDNSFETGVESIDKQHKVLIDKFNELEVAIDSGHSREGTGEVLDFLQFYADWHFGREEECMHEFECPIAQRNKESHDHFRLQFGRLYNDYYDNNLDGDLFRETVAGLADWIVNHIKRIDTGLRDCAY